MTEETGAAASRIGPIGAGELTLLPVKNSRLGAHQVVRRGDVAVGEIWRERTRVVVSKIDAPAKWDQRWRWFARIPGRPGVLGRATRRAFLSGAGFATKQDVLAQLVSALDAQQPITASI